MSSTEKISQGIYLVRAEHGMANGETTFTHAAYYNYDDAEMEQCNQVTLGAIEATIFYIPLYKSGDA